MTTTVRTDPNSRTSGTPVDILTDRDTALSIVQALDDLARNYRAEGYHHLAESAVRAHDAIRVALLPDTPHLFANDR